MEGSHASRSRDTAERDMRRWEGGRGKGEGACLAAPSSRQPTHSVRTSFFAKVSTPSAWPEEAFRFSQMLRRQRPQGLQQ